MGQYHPAAQAKEKSDGSANKLPISRNSIRQTNLPSLSDDLLYTQAEIYNTLY